MTGDDDKYMNTYTAVGPNDDKSCFFVEFVIWSTAHKNVRPFFVIRLFELCAELSI